MVKQVKIKTGASHRFKQRGGSMPEQIIISTQSLLILLLIAVIICGTFVYLATRAEKPVNIKLEMPEREKETVRERPSTSNLPPEPSRVYQTGPDFNTAGSVFNFPTQGYAEQFQQVGLLIAPGASALSASDRTLVPLYGRRIAARRDKWNYYSMSDKNNIVKLPITFKGRNGMAEYGVDSLNTGDHVRVEGYNDKFKVTMYDNKLLRYIPF